MKIDEVKLLICRQGLSEKLMTELLHSLRRVPGLWSKAQHCYLLGEEIAETDYAGSVQLIEYGLKHFAGDVQARRLGYEHLARVHRANLAFDVAKTCYETAKQLLALQRDKSSAYTEHIEAFYALRNELDLTGFTWSADLETYCRQVDREDEVFFGLRDDALTLFIAEYIIAEHGGDAEGMAALMDRIRRLLFDKPLSDMERMYRRHRIDPRVSLTGGEMDFLKRIGIL